MYCDCLDDYNELEILRLEQRISALEQELWLAEMAQDMCDRIDALLKSTRLSGESLDECITRLLEKK